MTIYGGDFEKREQIGKGGMAWVFKGRQISLDRPIAIKIMFPQLAEDEALRKLFLREGLSAANMDHENIVHVYRAGDEAGEPYIAMEFIDGLDLLHWLERHGQLPIEIAMIIFRDICRGLEHAHERNVIHRDIKPSNVMLSRDGAVKLMDFGLARRLDIESSLSTTGMVLGTIPYMSPEQSARQKVTTASDIFSLGIVGFELLGGEKPFKGETPSEVSRKIQVSDPPTLGKLNPLIPESMAQGIHQMLAKSPERRIRSVTEVLRQVEEAIDTLDVRRDRSLLRDYARDPDSVSTRLRKERLTRCLNEALFLESQGLNRIDEAIRAFGQVLAIDPMNNLASKRHALLVSERAKRVKERETQVSSLQLTQIEQAPPRDDSTPTVKRKSPVGRYLATALSVAVVAFAGWMGRAPISHLASGLIHPPAPPDPSVTSEPILPPPLSRVLISTSPTGAIVTFGSHPAEKSPVKFDSLQAGTYDFIVTLAGYSPISGAVNLGASQDTSIVFSMKREGDQLTHATAKVPPAAGSMQSSTKAPALKTPPLPMYSGTGTLVINATPAPEYFVDGKPKGSGETTVRLSVPEGFHTVRLDHKDYEIKEFADVWVRHDSISYLEWSFKDHASWIVVKQDGDYLGWIVLNKRPLNIQMPAKFPVRPGSYAVQVVSPGCDVEPSVRNVDVASGETMTVDFHVICK